MKSKKHIILELSKGDINLSPDVIILKDKKFFQPYITGAAINDDIQEKDGYVGGIMIAQPTGQYSGSTGLPTVEEQVFVVKNDAKEYWNDLKEWVKAINNNGVKVMETHIPNEAFKSLFES